MVNVYLYKILYKIVKIMIFINVDNVDKIIHLVKIIIIYK